MRKMSNILNIITILLILAYIIFTNQVYELLIKITGNTSTEIYNYSKIPYYLLWFSFILGILIKIIIYIKNKIKKDLNNYIVIFTSDIIILLFFISTFIFTTPFEFLEHKNINDHPDSIRYDKLFVMNKFYSNEGDYEGGLGDAKYIYIPMNKKIIYFTSQGIKTYKIDFLENNKVKVNNKEYEIQDSWYTES